MLSDKNTGNANFSVQFLILTANVLSFSIATNRETLENHTLKNNRYQQDTSNPGVFTYFT